MRRSHHHLTDQELLMALDAELPARHRASVEAHLEACTDCQARREQVGDLSRECSSLYQRERAAPDAIQSRARDELRARLSDAGRAREGWPASPFVSRVMWMPRWAMAGAALAVTAWLIQVAAPSRLRESASVQAAVERGALPSAELTPGVTWNIGVSELCAAGGATEVRPISQAVRQQVVRNYAMENVPPDEYELDYLITPELGGAPDPRNLWPQRYASRVWNARVKDQLERLLPQLVCDRRVPLETAQREIARDWIGAYRKYFKTNAPRQAEAHRSTHDEVDSQDAEDLRYPVWRSASAPRLELITFVPGR